MELAPEYENQLAKEWNNEKNKDSFKISICKPNTTAWWKCNKGHEWTTRIRSRIYKKSKCPFCAGKMAIPGENDVKTLYPQLAKEFHPTKNGDLKLENLMVSSGRKVWWQCKYGHEWQSIVNTRTKRSYGCPICSGKKIVPGVNDFLSVYPELSTEIHPLLNKEVDISLLAPKSKKKLHWRCSQGHTYEMEIYKKTGRGYGCPYCSGRRAIPGENDLKTVFPYIEQYWNKPKNGNIDEYTAHSSKCVWWICNEGHEWQNKISNQLNFNECPFCNGTRLVPGINDVATKYPCLVAEWDVNKNGVLASEIKASSHLKVFWKCKNGHSWKAYIGNRLKGEGCPFCRGKYAIVGVNDLVTLNPWVLKEWDYGLNHKNPEEFLPKSNRKVWWRCETGHSWNAKISERTRGTGCPICRKME